MSRAIKIPLEQYEELREEYIGICLKCGAERECCEPDAAHYECDECGAKRVFGMENLLIMGYVK